MQHRRSIRLPDRDYSRAGAYFVTICSDGRQLLFEHPSLRVYLNEEWQALARRYRTIQLDAFVVMPNHVHFIVWLTPPV